MICLCDLHTHSTASDGQYTPAELVTLAKARGIEALALTDHDTLDGVTDAMETGARLGLRVIPGVELSAREYPTFHFLGYGIPLEKTALTALCTRMKRGREERKYRILDFLREKGIKLSLEEVETLSGGSSGRPHFAQALVKRGFAASNREAFDRWLNTPEFFARVEREKPAARECVETVKAAGGKVSLAHPYQIGVDNDTLDGIVQELKDYGLDAIECYYPRFTPEQQAFYLFLTKKYGLKITGGSDFHGERVKPDISLAALRLDLSWL